MDEPTLRVWMQDVVAARRPPRDAARALGRRAGLAAARGRGRALAAAARAPARHAQRRVGRARTRAPGAPTAARATGRPTSAPRTGARSAFTFAAARAAARDPRLPGGRADARGSTARSALVAVRLCAVAPEGASLLVTRGLLNLTHRDCARARRAARARAAATTCASASTRSPTPSRAGHRLRARRLDRLLALGLALAGAGHAHAHGGRLHLPSAPPRDDPQPAFGRARAGRARSRSRRSSRAHEPHARPSTRHGAHEIRFEWDVGGHRRLVEAGTEMDDTNVTTYRITEGDPLSAEVHVRCMSALGRGDWRDARRDRRAHDLHRDRVPRHPAPRRLRGRGADPLTHVGLCASPATASDDTTPGTRR